VIPESVIQLAAGSISLKPCPIRAEWILEGDPIARNEVLSNSADYTASTLIWDCTSGRFNWFYSIDETIFVLEGGVVLRDVGGTGIARRLKAGDSVFFPAGSSAEWTVESYIRKIAFCRAPLPKPMVLAHRAMRLLKRILSSRASAAPAMFQSI
jgi:uncharacterized cupin superfamily protein